MAIHKIKFFAGRGSRYLAEKIAAEYGIKLGDSDVLQFGVIYVQSYELFG